MWITNFYRWHSNPMGTRRTRLNNQYRLYWERVFSITPERVPSHKIVKTVQFNHWKIYQLIISGYVYGLGSVLLNQLLLIQISWSSLYSYLLLLLHVSSCSTQQQPRRCNGQCLLFLPLGDLSRILGRYSLTWIRIRSRSDWGFFGVFLWRKFQISQWIKQLFTNHGSLS